MASWEELKPANDHFTVQMFQEVATTKQNQSCVLSAFSLLSPLTQLAISSVGPTHDEIITAIGYCCDTKATDVFGDINMRLKTMKGVELKLANKIYIRNDFKLNQEFAAPTTDVFKSEIQNIDFHRKEKVVNEINSWVKEHTNKRINDFISLESIGETSTAILVNAVCFKGKWTKPFQQSSTNDRQFHVAPNNIITVPMMFHRHDFKYKESPELDAKIIEMDYEGEQASLILALPNKMDGIHEFIQKIKDPNQLNQAIDSMSFEDVMLSIPKFRIDTTTDLKDILIKMNIKVLFQQGQAKFEHLVGESNDLYISSATQKTFFEMNEAGTDEAVGNEVAVGLGADANPNLKKFEADHPFAFFLMMKKNILLCGAYLS